MLSSQELTRRARKQTACTECQRRKQRCVFERGSPDCSNCAKRFPPVKCVVEALRDGTSPSQHGRLAVRARGATSMPPIANAEWLAAGAGAADREVDEWVRNAGRALARSGTNLILDGRGDPSTLRPFGGILTEVNGLNSLPMRHTARNAELLHFYLRFVAPNLVSIDGESQPIVFRREILSWQLQSPVFPIIGLLMACITQSLDRGLELDKSAESLAMKSSALSFINRFLGQAREDTFHNIAGEAVKCVINLVVMEWFWGTDESMKAHMRGVREMLRLRGGMRGLRDPVAEGIVILTDYEISCCFESDVYWQQDDPTMNTPLPVPDSWPDGFDCPLIPSDSTFQSIADKLGITAVTANILDDVRFLTTSITTIPDQSKPSDAILKIRSTAEWLYKRLEVMQFSVTDEGSMISTTEESRLIHDSVHRAALAYVRSLRSLTLISILARQEQAVARDLDICYSAMRQVSLSRWKKVPGIFLWIMLVLCPNSTNDRRGRFVRRKMAVAGLSIGFEDFLVGISYLRGFWLTQRWIVAQQDEKSKEEKETPTAQELGEPFKSASEQGFVQPAPSRYDIL